VGGCAPGGRGCLPTGPVGSTLSGAMDTNTATAMTRPAAGKFVVLLEALLLGLVLLLVL
jgi:hypothetical protein